MLSRAEEITIRRLYIDEGLSRDKIAQLLGVPHSAVTRVMVRSGQGMRPPRTPTIISELTTSKPNPPRIETPGTRVIVRHQIRLTIGLAYLFGWVIGDGYANKREVDAIVSKRERKCVEDFLSDLLKPFGNILVVERHGTCIIRCLSTKLSRILCKPSGQNYWRNMALILASPKFAGAFIAGLWDADGGTFLEASGAFRTHLYNSDLILLHRLDFGKSSFELSSRR